MKEALDTKLKIAKKISFARNLKKSMANDPRKSMIEK